MFSPRSKCVWPVFGRGQAGMHTVWSGRRRDGGYYKSVQIATEGGIDYGNEEEFASQGLLVSPKASVGVREGKVRRQREVKEGERRAPTHPPPALTDMLA